MVTKMKNCPSCGRLYVPLTAAQKLCPDCMDKMREKEHEVVEYVRDHPKVKIAELIEATGASENMIKRMIREGRFIQTGVKMTYPCEKCGAPIVQGKLCAKCTEALKKDLAGAAKKIASAAAPKGGLGGTGKGPRPTNGERPSSFRSERDKQQPSKQSKRYRGLR
ncbi:MAG: flagellar protein [Selenomonadaceae bacterium]|nr:flagellar protein [Selenomonadaceae bacterium]